MAKSDDESPVFTLKVLGRTLEHLGVQMYKRRENAIAELVANSWDAGATEVEIEVPVHSEYNTKKSHIAIKDKGAGMDAAAIQDAYLVVGRNRRKHDKAPARPVMGRKGIGKLAGFGIANQMTVSTWRDGKAHEFTLNADALKAEDNNVGNVQIPSKVSEVADKKDHGTRIVLSDLKHVTPIDLSKLRESLARRFSSRVRGEMVIRLNAGDIGEPHLDLQKRVPKTGMNTSDLGDGTKVQFWYGFAKDVIKSQELRGFTIHVRGKTAQAPPFFFNVEATASGQHGTKYLTGAIEADFLDEGNDDASDVISTDRQEIDWDSTKVTKLREWGEKLTRAALMEWVALRGEEAKNIVFEDESLKERIVSLDGTSQKQITNFLTALAKVDSDPASIRTLANSLVRAYEFRQFHDIIDQLEQVAEDDPQQLHNLISYLGEWKILESRAILEIIEGRLEIIEKFHNLVVNDAAETAHKTGDDNVHDLLATYPWLIDPEWQVLGEETRITKQLKEWNVKDAGADAERYDFLALGSDAKLKVIEIKRSGHPVTLEEFQRLERYKSQLAKAHPDIEMVLISGGTYDVDKSTRDEWDRRRDTQILTWDGVYQRVKRHYEHYRAVLEADPSHPDFKKKELEAKKARRLLESGSSFRGKKIRDEEGLGSSDVSFDEAFTKSAAQPPRPAQPAPEKKK